MNNEDQFFNERPDNNIFKQIIYKYLPFWPLFVVTVGISMVVAYIKLRAEVPVYVASARVVLTDKSRSGGESKVLDALNIFSEKKVLDNEIVTLRSGRLMERVVKDLDLYASVFNKGNVRTEELYNSNAPLKFIAVNKDSFNLWKTLFFSMDWKNNQILIDNKRVAFNDTLHIDGIPMTMEVNSKYNKAADKNFFVTFSHPASVAGGLAGSLRISPYSYSSTILNLSMNTTVPAKARPVMSRLFEIYNMEAMLDKNFIADKTMNFIDERLELVTRQLDSVERNISGYRSEMSVVDLGTQASNYFSRVVDLDKARSELDLQLDALSDVRAYVQRKDGIPGTVPSLMIVSNPTLSGLLDRLYTAEITANKLKSVTGERNDALLQAHEEVDKIKGDIMENMANIRNDLLMKRRDVDSRIAQSNALLRTIPEKERRFIDISRQQSVKNNIYTYLLQKKEETAIASVATTPDLKVIDSPSAYGPVQPVARNFYLTGLVVGLLGGAFLVLLKEVFTRKVLFRSELESKVKLPVMGELVQVASKGSPIVIGDGNRTIIAEQIRAVRTNLAFMGLGDDKNTLLVTSSISGEGKSFVAINLAISFTLTGKKVALMEMDLRKPKLSKILGVSRRPGTSTYLAGKADIDSIVKETSIPGLFLVSAGPVPPNPTELISSEKFGVMVGELKKRFDYVIMDTAPVSPVADAQLLQEHSDINLFVVRHGVTPRVFLPMIEGLHQQKKFKHMCLLFNGVKPRGFRIYGYGFGGYGNGYGYSYGYGYGYGSEYGGGYYIEDERNILQRLLGRKGSKRAEEA